MKKTLKIISKKTLSIVLAMAMVFSIVLSCITLPAVADAMSPDTDWYNSNNSTFTIYTARQLLGLSELCRNGETFCDKTILLGTDIDLNPGWRAMVTFGDNNTVIFPEAPENIWQPIPLFAGTIDGQGHTIRGIYVAEHFTSDHQMAGFIKDFDGRAADVGSHTNTPTIKDLVFDNGLILAYGNCQPGCVVGGVAGWAEGKVTIDGVYSDMHVWMINYSWGYVGGLVGRTGYSDGQNIIRNCMVDGTTGTVAGGALLSSGTYPSTSESMKTAQIVAGCKYATIDNCLARGTIYYKDVAQHGYLYATQTETGHNYFTNNEIGNVPSYNAPSGWRYISHLGTAAPSKIGNMVFKSIQMYSHYDPAGTVYAIATSADLVRAAELSQSGETFSGKTLRLTADIDLNPGWDLSVGIPNPNSQSSQLVTLPKTPTVQFPGFATFAGTLDGQSHTISGLYMAKTLGADSQNLGFVEFLQGTVKNVRFNNGFIFARPYETENPNWGAKDCKIGGIAAHINGQGAKIENVYSKLNVWYRSFRWERIGGFVGIVEAANVSLNNVVFAGTVGTIAPNNNNAPNGNSESDMSISQLIAHGGWKESLTLTACRMNGKCYASVSASAAVAKCDKANKTNINNTPTVTTPGDYVKVLPNFNIWPNATVDTKTAGYETDTPSFVKYYQYVTAENYLAYIDRLARNGYTLLQTNFPYSGIRYDLLDNEYYTVYLSYIPGKASSYRMRLSVSPSGVDYDLQNTAISSTNVCSAKLIQLNVDNSYSQAAGGMSYVIRLTNGEFIVIDGGYASKWETDKLYDTLSEYNELSGNPVIAGWFITHLHNDHYGCLTRFAKEHQNDVDVKAFYYNFPTHNISGTDGIPERENIYEAETAIGAFPKAKLYSKIHSGMTICFAGATATILYTHEDAGQSWWNGNTVTQNSLEDGNDTSTVIKFTVGNEKMIFLGDARNGAAAAIITTFPTIFLNAKFLQVSHHGYGKNSDTILKNLYQIVSAQVYLWPQDVLSYKKVNGNIVPKGLTENNQGFYYLYSQHPDSPATTYIKNLGTSVEVIPCYETVYLTLGNYTAKSTYNINWLANNGAAIIAKYNTKKNNSNLWDCR